MNRQPILRVEECFDGRFAWSLAQQAAEARSAFAGLAERQHAVGRCALHDRAAEQSARRRYREQRDGKNPEIHCLVPVLCLLVCVEQCRALFDTAAHYQGTTQKQNQWRQPQ